MQRYTEEMLRVVKVGGEVRIWPFDIETRIWPFRKVDPRQTKNQKVFLKLYPHAEVRDGYAVLRKT
jgi:hypothetical protein